MSRNLSFWLPFLSTGLIILTGYFILGRFFISEIEPYLKGLHPLQHFLIHYAVGLAVGLAILIVNRVFLKKNIKEVRILSWSVVWSHLPDLAFLIHRSPHPDWMIIFWGHTVVDNSFLTFYLFLFIDLILGFIYIRLSRR